MLTLDSIAAEQPTEKKAAKGKVAGRDPSKESPGAHQVLGQMHRASAQRAAWTQTDSPTASANV